MKELSRGEFMRLAKRALEDTDNSEKVKRMAKASGGGGRRARARTFVRNVMRGRNRGRAPRNPTRRQRARAGIR